MHCVPYTPVCILCCVQFTRNLSINCSLELPPPFPGEQKNSGAQITHMRIHILGSASHSTAATARSLGALGNKYFHAMVGNRNQPQLCVWSSLLIHSVLLTGCGWLQSSERSLRWLINDLRVFEVLTVLPFEVPVCEVGSSRSEQRTHKHSEEPCTTAPVAPQKSAAVRPSSVHLSLDGCDASTTPSMLRIRNRYVWDLNHD